MALSTMACGKTIKLLEKVLFIMLTEMSTKEIGSKIELQDMVSIRMRKETFMKANGIMMFRMEMAQKNGLMDLVSKAILRMV